MKFIFWVWMRILAVLILIGLPSAGYLLNLPKPGWMGFMFILLLHTAELPISMPIAKQKKIPYAKALIKNFLFGFTWWVPLNRGIIEH